MNQFFFNLSTAFKQDNSEIEMIRPILFSGIFLPLFIGVQIVDAQRDNSSIPALREQGNATQLIVAEKPFILLGGETGNLSESDICYVQPIRNKMQQLHFNTVLAPVYRKLIEPRKSWFDFGIQKLKLYTYT